MSVPLSSFGGEGRGEEALISTNLRAGSMNGHRGVRRWPRLRYMIAGLLSPTLSSKGGEGDARFARFVNHTQRQ